MFERFTERARQVVVFAQDEARGLRHNYIGTEHLLLGILRVDDGLAAHVLEGLDVTIEGARAEVARLIGEGDEVPTGQIPFTPRAKKVLELSLREALDLGHNYIGTEHVLLGIAREDEGVAARALRDLGVDAETIRGEIVRMLGGRKGDPPAVADVEPGTVRRTSRIGRVPRGSPTFEARFASRAVAFVLGWLLFAVSLAIGVFVGWLIWGE